MDGLGTDDTGDFLFPHHHALGNHDARIDALGLVDQEAIFHGSPDDHAHFIHVCADHHFLPFALLVGIEISHGVGPHLIGIVLGNVFDVFSYAAFVAGNAV